MEKRCRNTAVSAGAGPDRRSCVCLCLGKHWSAVRYQEWLYYRSTTPAQLRVPLYPLQDGRSCLQNGACARRVIHSPCLPSSRYLPTVARIPLDPQRLYPAKVNHSSLSPSRFIPFEDFSPSARLARPSSSSTTPPAPSLDHPDLPFLSLDHSDYSQNKCYPHLPRFPFPQALRLWLFCGLLSTARDRRGLLVVASIQHL